MSGKRLVMSTVAAVAGVLILGACGQAATSGAPVGIAVVAAQQQEVPVSLNAAEVDGLGTVLTDQNGMTLYRFDKDSADPPTSNCDRDCALAWPPVVTEEEVAVAGVDKSLVGTMPRVDGDSQVTVGGWPLYRFARDTRPGQANGQGAGDVWYAATPEGRKAGLAPAKVAAKDLSGFGAALADQNGLTLYLFTKDSKDPSKSVCDGECAQTWPPLLVDDASPAIAGVDPAIVDKVARDDGTRQVTVGGWPVYRYTGDTEPGQTNGHGVGGTWFVIEPAGCKSPAPV